MLFNFVLLALLFGATKRRINRYASAAAFGGIKGILYFAASESVVGALVAFGIFAGLATLLVWLLARVDVKDLQREPYSAYGSKRPMQFQWEYLPISVAMFLILFGELTFSLLFGS